MLRLMALALVASLGCAPALLSPVEGDDAEAEELKARIVELQDQARDAEAELERLRSQVSELEARLAERAPDPQPEARLDDGVGALDTRDAQAIESADIPPPRATPLESPGAGEPLSAEAQELYDRGYTLYHQSLYLDAESAFQRFLGRHPASELADNAHYWIGEARFARADFRGALAAFRETVQRFPNGNKVPDALLRQADTLVRLGDPGAAREIYDEVIRRFPTSAAAPSAEERLAELP